MSVYLNEQDFARRYQLSRRTVQRLRESGDGPPFYRISTGRTRGRVVYREDEIEVWLAGRRRTSTSDTGTPGPAPEPRAGRAPRKRSATAAHATR